MSLSFEEAMEYAPETDYETCLGCGHLSVIETRYLRAVMYGTPQPAERDGRCTCGDLILDWCDECYHGYHCACCDPCEGCECRCKCECRWET